MLKRPISLKLRLMYNYQSKKRSLKEAKELIQIEVSSQETGSTWFWSLGKFKNRSFIIKDLFSRFLCDSVLPVPARAIDPFWEPEEEVLAGEAVLLLQPVLFG